MWLISHHRDEAPVFAVHPTNLLVGNRQDFGVSSVNRCGTTTQFRRGLSLDRAFILLYLGYKEASISINRRLALCCCLRFKR